MSQITSTKTIVINGIAVTINSYVRETLDLPHVEITVDGVTIDITNAMDMLPGDKHASLQSAIAISDSEGSVVHRMLVGESV